MNILLITEFFPKLKNPIFTGGVEARCYYLAKYLSKRNTITVISRKLKNQSSFEKINNLKIIRLGLPQKSPEASVFSLISRFFFQFQAFFEGIKVKADLVEGSNFITYLPAFFVAKKQKAPCVAWYPDVFISRWRLLFGAFLGFFGEITERLVLKLPWNAIIAISESTKNKIIKNSRLKNIQVIPCGVDLKEFSKLKKYKNPTVIAISRLEKYKRIGLLKDIKNFDVIIVGAGTEEKKLKKLLPNAIFKKNLPRNELVRLLGKSHIFCHPSLEEGFGIVLIESLAAGTPFVASDIPAVREITEGGKGGILISSNDFAAQVKLLIENKKMYNILRKEGKELVKKYSWEKISRKTYECYRSVAHL